MNAPTGVRGVTGLVNPRVRVVAAACVGFGLLAACGSGGDASKSSTPVSGGGLTFATDAVVDCLDPQVSPADITAVVDRNIFDSLVSLTPDGKFHPWLADKWTLSPDGKTYTFHLKSGVTFHDGTPLTAAAVKATLDHAVDPKTKSQYAGSLMRAYAGATVVDDHTVKVKLSRPNTQFLSALSSAYLGIQSPKSLTANAGKLCEKPVGSGPFSFVSWTKNKSIVMKKYPGYKWGPTNAKHTGAAYLDTLTVSFMPENSVRVGALTSGQVNVVGHVPPANVKSLQANSSLQVLRAESPGANYNIFFNTTRGAFKDERVRKALQRSVDLDALVKSLYFGQYQRAWSPLGPTTIDYDPATENSWAYDPALANKLLDQAGWTSRDAQGYRTKGGKRLSLQWPFTSLYVREQRDVLAEGIQADAKKVGIQLVRVNADPGTWTQDYLSGNYDLMDYSFVRAEPDILRYEFASDQLVAMGGGNLSMVKSAALDAWLNGAAASGDPTIRKQDYAKAQHYVLDHALVMPAYVPPYLLAASKKVHGLAFEAQAYPLFYDTWLEK
ncbi:ABC transporter substrate-binding protein [Streptomyces sp. NPDC002920]